MLWFWLNVPLMVVFFGAWCGIPLVKVLRNQTWGSQRIAVRRVQPAEQGPAGVVYHGEPRVDALAPAGAQR
jgi:hypothetical protein